MHKLCKIFALLCMIASASAKIPGAKQASRVYQDPADENEQYSLAELLFQARPIRKFSRMYPHVLPFSDMLHPSKRSYQFGFPEILRSGMSREVPTDIIFYKQPTRVNPSGILSSTSPSGPQEAFFFNTWMTSRSAMTGRSEPVRLAFDKLFSIQFDLHKDLLDLLGNDIRINDQTDIRNLYLYRDQIREFLVGAWESMREDGVFHDEEGLWRSHSLECRNPIDVACFWRRFLLIIISSNVNTFESANLRRPTIDESLYNQADSAATAFWLFYCRMLHKMSIKGEVFDHYCPNPCRNNPCVDMAHTMTDNCEVYQNGMYDKDFKCTCLETAKWSFSKRKCVIYDRCKMESPCSLTGSESCQYDPLINEVKCYCKPGFMGATCSEPRNACYERQRTKLGTKPTGNQACNVDAGSHCDPVLGTDVFTCRCSNGWLIDTGGSYREGEELDPNCQLRHDPCMSLPCEVGDCVSSSGQAICQCPATHYGRNCQHRRGLWSTWGPWSSCDPDCGDRRERHRSRSCLGLECLGHSFESDWCMGGCTDCGVPERLGPYRTDRWRTAMVLRHMFAAMAVATAIGMGCLFACQCLLSVALKCDRSLLDSAVRERAHVHQLLAYHRLSYKTVFRLN